MNIFLIIDALGWRILGQHRFLEEKLPLTKATRSIFGFSSSAIPTILTGKYPCEHSRWNLLYRSPQTSPFSWTKALRVFPKSLLEHRVARKIVDELSKKMCGAEGYFSSYGVPARQLHMFDVCEKKNIYKPGGIAGNETIIDYMEKSRIPYRVYSYHDGPDEHLMTTMRHDIEKGEYRIFFAYLAELDSFLHQHCGENEAVTRKIEWYDGKIRGILDVAEKRGGEVRVFVFSDHGMTPVSSHYDLVSDLTGAGNDLERDCMAAFDSTMARFWVDDPAIKAKVREVLDRCTAGRIIPDAELESLGVYFPDQRYGDIIFLMNPGTLIFPNWFGRYAPRGMHGFHPDEPHSDAVYMSNVTDYSPESIVDLFDIMKREINLLKEAH